MISDLRTGVTMHGEPEKLVRFVRAGTSPCKYPKLQSFRRMGKKAM